MTHGQERIHADHARQIWALAALFATSVLVSVLTGCAEPMTTPAPVVVQPVPLCTPDHNDDTVILRTGRCAALKFDKDPRDCGIFNPTAGDYQTFWAYCSDGLVVSSKGEAYWGDDLLGSVSDEDCEQVPDTHELCLRCSSGQDL